MQPSYNKSIELSITSYVFCLAVVTANLAAYPVAFYGGCSERCALKGNTGLGADLIAVCVSQLSSLLSYQALSYS